MKMTAEALLQQIANDIADIKNRMINLEGTLEELDTDLHEVRPEYVEKLKKIEAEETISDKDFEKEFGVKI